MAQASGGGNIGFGMEFFLKDSFSNVATRIQTSMRNLNAAASNQAKSQIQANQVAKSGQLLAASVARTKITEQTLQNNATRNQEKAAKAEKINALLDQKFQNNALKEIERQDRIRERAALNIERQADGMRQFQSGYNQVLNGLGTVTMAAAFAAPGAYALKMAGDFEQAKIRLETLLHSKEKAGIFFQEMKDDALKLPLMGFKDLIKANSFLIAAGVGAESARSAINDLAVTSMVTGGTKDSFNRMAYNLSQAKNKGYADGTDIRQFANANIPIAMLMKKYKGKNIYSGDKKDKPSYQDLTDILKIFAEENKAILKEIENSVTGQSAILKERFEYVFAAIGEAIAPIFVSIAKKVNYALERLEAFFLTPIGKFTAQVLSAVGAIGSLVLVGVGLFKVFGGLKSMWGGFAKMIAKNGGFMVVIRNLASDMLIMYGVIKMLNSNSQGLFVLGIALSFFLGKIGILVVGVTILSRAFEEWNKWINSTTRSTDGIAFRFAQLGGILSGIFEVLNNLNNEGWKMNAQMVENLSNAGVLGLVQKFGMMAHFIYRNGEAFGYLAMAMAGVATIFRVVASVLTTLKIFGLITTDIKAGAAIWKVLSGIFTFLARTAIPAVATAFMTLGVALGVNPVTWIILGIIAVILILVALFAPDKWWEYGKNMANGLLQGLKSMDKVFTDWMHEHDPFYWKGGHEFGKNIHDFITGDNSGNSTSYTPTQYMNENGGDMRTIKATQLQGASAFSSQGAFSQVSPVEHVTNMYLDGEIIWSNSKKHDDFQYLRSSLGTPS